MVKYDFVEIGTSDFATEIEKATDQTKGLSIEPIKMYLDNLPDKKNVTKINAAVSNYTGNINVFYVSPENIKKYDLPKWVRGCNSVGEYHKTVKRLILKLGLEPKDIFIKKRVKVLQFKDLVKKYNITEIKYLKTDTEGHDPVVLNNYLDYIELRPKIAAHVIQFESNVLSKRQDVRDIIKRFQKNKYRLIKSGMNTVLVLKGHKLTKKKDSKSMKKTKKNKGCKL